MVATASLCSIATNRVIHDMDHRAYVAFTSLVFLRLSFHLYSKPEPSFQKSNTQSPNTNYKQISSCLKFIKNALIKRFILRAFTQTSAQTLCNS